MLDVIFLSFFEANAEDNWSQLTSRFPHVKRVDGISPIGAAHRQCASIAETDYFYVVDADAIILDSFDFDFIPDPKVRWPGGNFQDKYVYVWRSLNPVNNLVYGYGGVKLFPREGVLNHKVWKPDFATSVAEAFRPMPEISNITAFDFSEYNTWKSAFRECSKLQSKVIARQKDDETELRLWSWRTQCGKHKFGIEQINARFCRSCQPAAPCPRRSSRQAGFCHAIFARTKSRSGPRELTSGVFFARRRLG